MKFIQPGDWVECDAALWQTIAEDVTSPGQMVLRRATDGHLAIRPRTRLLPAATDITGEKRNVLSDLSELQHADPKDRERAQLIAETIARVRSGDYSLEGQTIAVAIRSELASQGVSLSLRQIQRYGRAGLVDHRAAGIALLETVTVVWIPCICIDGDNFCDVIDVVAVIIGDDVTIRHLIMTDLPRRPTTGAYRCAFGSTAPVYGRAGELSAAVRTAIPVAPGVARPFEQLPVAV